MRGPQCAEGGLGFSSEMVRELRQSPPRPARWSALVLPEGPCTQQPGGWRRSFTSWPSRPHRDPCARTGDADARAARPPPAPHLSPRRRHASAHQGRPELPHEGRPPSQRQFRGAHARPGGPRGAPLVPRTVGGGSGQEGEGAGRGHSVERSPSPHPAEGGRLSGCSSRFWEVYLFFLSADGRVPAISARAAWPKLGRGECGSQESHAGPAVTF